MAEEEVRTEETAAHAISVSMVQAATAELDAGSDMALKVKVSCSLACDLHGKTIRIVSHDAVVVKEAELTRFDDTANETDEFVVKAPIEPGAYTWTAVLPAQEEDGALHQEGSTPFSFIVKPHATSMAVWDVTSPAVFNADARFKVGVKCAANCSLAGKQVEIYDHEGAKVAVVTLSDAPYSDMIGLYWAEVEFKAPDAEGCYRWEARFPEPDLELAHQAASYTFGFSTVRPPECTLTVEVINKEAERPIKNARVLLRPGMCRGYTDERGVAKIQAAKGEYQLFVAAREKAPKGIVYKCAGVPVATKGKEYKLYVPEANRDDMKPFATTITVDRDIAIKVELVGVIEPLVEDTL